MSANVAVWRCRLRPALIRTRQQAAEQSCSGGHSYSLPLSLSLSDGAHLHIPDININRRLDWHLPAIDASFAHRLSSQKRSIFHSLTLTDGGALTCRRIETARSLWGKRRKKEEGESAIDRSQ